MTRLRGGETLGEGGEGWKLEGGNSVRGKYRGKSSPACGVSAPFAVNRGGGLQERGGQEQKS